MINNIRSFSPFYVRGKQVVPELVIMVRLLSVYLLLTSELPFLGNQGGGRFYPLLDFLYHIGTDSQFNLAVRALFYAGILILLCSSFVRAGSFMAGSAFVIGMLSCQTCLSVAHLFVSCLFICTALSNDETGQNLIRFQLIVLYIGADLNKVIDIDWWTGASIEALLVSRHQIPAYINAVAFFRPMLLSQVSGLGVIILQLIIPFLLLNKKYLPYAMLGGLLLHLPMVLLMQMTFGPFLVALVLAYASQLKWPEKLIFNPAEHNRLLVHILKVFDFNEQVILPQNKPTEKYSETPVKWLRTLFTFLTHPAILLALSVLAAACVRYGRLVPLSVLVIFLFYSKAWVYRQKQLLPPRNPVIL